MISFTFIITSVKFQLELISANIFLTMISCNELSKTLSILYGYTPSLRETKSKSRPKVLFRKRMYKEHQSKIKSSKECTHWPLLGCTQGFKICSIGWGPDIDTISKIVVYETVRNQFFTFNIESIPNTLYYATWFRDFVRCHWYVIFPI